MLQSELKDPPNVDFLDVEVNDDRKEQLRTDMIDLKEDTVELDTFRVAPDRVGRYYKNLT